MAKCPTCGRRVNSSRWKRQKFRDFNYAPAVAMPRLEAYTRNAPARGADLTGDVFIPYLKALITASFAGLATAMIASFLRVPQPGYTGFAGGVTGGAIVWGALLIDHQKLLWTLERATGVDLDRDGAVGKPLQVEVTEYDDRGRLKRMRFVDLPFSITDETLGRLAQAVLLQKREFSRRKLPVGLLSSDQYSELTQAMLDGGLLRYRGKGGQAGVELTGSGRAFLRQFLPHPKRS